MCPGERIRYRRYVPGLALPWLALAFAAGRTAGRRALPAGAAGVGAIAVGLVTYYAFKAAYYGLYSIRDLHYTGTRWAALAVALGSAVGLTGSLSVRGSPRHRTSASAALAGAAFAEASVLPRGLRHPWTAALVAAECIAAGLLRHAARFGHPLVAVTTASAVTLLGIAAHWLVFELL